MIVESNKKLNKQEKERYVLICEYTWGCVPVEINWAMETKIYKEMEKKLINSNIFK